MSRRNGFVIVQMRYLRRVNSSVDFVPAQRRLCRVCAAGEALKASAAESFYPSARDQMEQVPHSALSGFDFTDKWEFMSNHFRSKKIFIPRSKLGALS